VSSPPPGLTKPSVPIDGLCRVYGGEGPKLQSDNENILTDRLATLRVCDGS